MTGKTAIYKEIRAADAKVQYDEHVKRILALKNILAWILKGCTEEYRRMSIEEIMECIEPDIYISSISLRPGDETNKQKESVRESKAPYIIGSGTEDKVPGEGTVFFDVRFTVILPGTGIRKLMKLLINIEAQKKFYTSYEYVTRGIFYAARMISAQLDKEFMQPHYEDMKKVYSIWICMNAPKKIGNAITVYEIEKHNMVGNMPSEKVNYDKLAVVIVCLNEKVKENQTGLHRLLNVLLSSDMPLEEKVQILEAEFKIPMTMDLEEEMNEMCNLSEAIEEKGIRKGKREGIDMTRIEAVESLMCNLNLTLEKALEALNLSAKEYEKSVRNIKAKA